MNIQLSTFNRILIVGGLFLVIALLGFFFVVQPKKNQEAVTIAQINDLQGQYDELKRVADQKPLYLALNDQIRKRLTGVEVTADPRSYIPSYMKQIEDLARRDGLVVTSVSPQATPAPSPVPSGAPTPAAGTPLTNLPVVGAPLKQATHVLGAENARAVTTNEAIGGTSPVPRGPTPLPGQAPGTNPPGVAAGSARAAALAYLNQSFTQVPVNMEFQGRYEQFETFLRDLSKFPKLLGVGDVTLVPTGNITIGVSPPLKITLPVTAYRLSPNAAQAPGPIAPASPAPGGK
jgi:Tfp pilus assembly protein PilO